MVAALLMLLSLAAQATRAASQNATDSLPPVLMHYMPWFNWGREQGWGGYHWKENLNWSTLLAERRVASHFTPLVGPYNSVDRDVIRYHLDLMQAAGIRGVIVNWYGTRDMNDFVNPNLHAADAIIEEASAKGMMFTVCYEDWTVVDGLKWGEEPTGALLDAARAQMRLDFEHVRDTYASKPGFLRESNQGMDGRPIMLVFGPRTMKTGSEWTSAFADVFPDEASRPRLVTLYGAPVVGDGQFSWFPPMKAEADLGPQEEVLAGVHGYLSDFYEADRGLRVGSVFAGFHDYYAEGRGTQSYGRLPEYDGVTMEASLARAKLHQPNFAQVATWNDWEEGTIIEPAEERSTPYKYLLKLQQHILGRASESEFSTIFENFKALKGADFGWPTLEANAALV